MVLCGIGVHRHAKVCSAIIIISRLQLQFDEPPWEFLDWTHS